MKNHVSLSVKAEFVFDYDCELTPAEFMEDIIDRIRRGEYFPSELVDLQVMQVNSDVYAKGF